MKWKHMNKSKVKNYARGSKWTDAQYDAHMAEHESRQKEMLQLLKEQEIANRTKEIGLNFQSLCVHIPASGDDLKLFSVQNSTLLFGKRVTDQTLIEALRNRSKTFRGGVLLSLDVYEQLGGSSLDFRPSQEVAERIQAYLDGEIMLKFKKEKVIRKGDKL
ncbi:hypothetical protein K1804_002933 [Listeria monocytogenes]|uniref:hypothetical protein n=1 Tax=Listeria seeligeri TaxID=1640 RepID=UPI00162544B2|nr:hypothetical protein [Listeria seeligeri]EFM0818574.1 hypothetical protein [Listeria monocytogenes]EFM2966959.1 hypothetical protein [Listeria monocytogenes]EHX3821629.1 hypothetical protein [Listeria monocytogenes]EHX3879541.1 hypothetical protein [Listeria monocytogenes]MBC1597635.1 hypothetical protein [Listeria seeligeri]